MHEIIHFAYLFRLRLEHADKLLAYYLALGLGIGHARELCQEPIFRVYGDKVHALLVAENAHDLFRLALTQQSVVDEYAREVFASAVYKRRRDRGIHSAR